MGDNEFGPWDAEVQSVLGQDDWSRIVAAVDARIRVRPFSLSASSILLHVLLFFFLILSATTGMLQGEQGLR